MKGFGGETDLKYGNMKQRKLIMVGLALLWLVVANATCDSSRRRQELIRSSRVARYHLRGCRDMGAGRLDPESLERAVRLADDIDAMLARQKWYRAGKAISRLEEIVAGLLEKMKGWDADGDNLSNYAEFMLYGTSWDSRDSDGDGYLDGSEILRYETDPLDHCAVPVDVPPEAPMQQRCPALEELGQAGEDNKP